jgi:hypothetical protein
MGRSKEPLLTLDGEKIKCKARGKTNPEGSLTELTPEGKHAFRMTGENRDTELVVFEVGPDGKVVRIKVSENYIYPKERASGKEQVKLSEWPRGMKEGEDMKTFEKQWSDLMAWLSAAHPKLVKEAQFGWPGGGRGGKSRSYGEELSMRKNWF